MVLISYNSLDMAGIMTFQVTHINNTTDLFYTFCIQDNVYINVGVTYYVGRVSNQVGYLGPQPSYPLPNGGVGTLDYRVDYLFTEFASGAYNKYFNGTYNGISGQVYQADFQKLLWSYQGTGPSYTPIYPFWNNDLQQNASLGHTYSTAVLNLTTGFSNGVGTGHDVQNMLVDPPIANPEPSSLLLLGSGLTALGWAIRRRK